MLSNNNFSKKKNPEDLGSVLLPCSSQRGRGGGRIISRAVSPRILTNVNVSQEDCTDVLRQF